MQALGGLDNNKVLIPPITVEVPIARIRPHDVVVVVAAGGCLLHFFWFQLEPRWFTAPFFIPALTTTHHSPRLISDYLAGEKIHNKNFDDHISTI